MPILKCPQCGSTDLAMSKERMECGKCGNGLPLLWGEVPDFSPAPGFKDTWKHACTYSYSSRIYEFWRKGVLIKLSTGVTFWEELELTLERIELADNLCVLDVGCGTGIFSREFAKRSDTIEVWGLDYSYSQLRQALAYKKRDRLSNLHFVHGLAADLPFAGESFDRVCTIGAMHFFEPFQDFFSEAYRVLKPGGILAAASFLDFDAKPSDAWYIRLVQKRARDIGVHFFSEREVIGLAEKAGFKEIEYFGKGIFLIIKAKK